MIVFYPKNQAKKSIQKRITQVICVRKYAKTAEKQTHVNVRLMLKIANIVSYVLVVPVFATQIYSTFS